MFIDLEMKDLDHHQHRMNCPLAQRPPVLKGLRISCCQSDKQQLPNRGDIASTFRRCKSQTGSQRIQAHTHTHTQDQGPHVRSIDSWVKRLLSCSEAAGGKVKLIEFVWKIFSAHLDVSSISQLWSESAHGFTSLWTQQLHTYTCTHFCTHGHVCAHLLDI